MLALRILVAVIGLAWLASSPSSARDEVELRPYFGRLRTIEIEVEGQIATMLFDTGAGITSVTPEFAARIGCTPRALTTAFRMDGERVTFQRCSSMRISVAGKAGHRELGVFDLNSVLPAELPRLDGVAGLDIFDGSIITITSGLTAVRLETRHSLRRVTAGVNAGRLRLSREAGGAGLTVFARAQTPAGDAWLLLDSGNLAGLRLHPWVITALLAGEQPAAHAAVPLIVEGAGRRAMEAESVDALIYDGALPADYLAQYDITLDFLQNRIWWRLTPR